MMEWKKRYCSPAIENLDDSNDEIVSAYNETTTKGTMLTERWFDEDTIKLFAPPKYNLFKIPESLNRTSANQSTEGLQEFNPHSGGETAGFFNGVGSGKNVVERTVVDCHCKGENKTCMFCGGKGRYIDVIYTKVFTIINS